MTTEATQQHLATTWAAARALWTTSEEAVAEWLATLTPEECDQMALEMAQAMRWLFNAASLLGYRPLPGRM